MPRVGDRCRRLPAAAPAGEGAADARRCGCSARRSARLSVGPPIAMNACRRRA